MWSPTPLAAAIALAGGIAAAPIFDRLGVPWGARWAVAAALVATAAALARLAEAFSVPGPGERAARRARFALLAAMAAIGTARGSESPPQIPAGAIADDRGIDRVEGEVAGPVVVTPRGSGGAVGDVWVWAGARLDAGERIAATGRLRTVRGRLELSALRIERLADDPGLLDRAWRWAAAGQAWAAARIDEAGGDPIARAALRGIAVGDRSEVPPALDDRWRACGIYHVLSVSGLHLAVIAGLVFSLLRKLIAGSPWGGRVRPARWAAPPALALAIAYTLVTGAQLATVRALIVIALVLVAAMLDRPLRLLDALGAAALLVLALRPDDLYDPSFQLSFVAALTLALRPRVPVTGGRLRRWVVAGVTTSAWIALTTAPLTAYHFTQIAAGGIAGNVVLTPLVEAVALPIALAGVVLGPLGVPLVRLATWLVSLVDGAAGLLAHVTPVGRIAIASGWVVVVLVALSLWLAARRSLGWREGVVWAALCLGWIAGRAPPPAGALRVTFVDVGQGDAAIIELPDGAVWLVDAGGNASARDPIAASAPGKTLSRALAASGHDRIDLAILSHPHPDHYLGLAALDVPIAELWTADELTPSTGPAAQLVQQLAARGTRIVHPPLGRGRDEAGVSLDVLAPRYRERDSDPEREAADPVRTVNDNSLVVAISFAGRRVLFAGDLEHEGEEALVAAGLSRADVVKVPHHGSPTSSSAAFVAATAPSLAVISCGRANAFGFPSPAVVARWRAAGAEVRRTDEAGDVVITIDAGGGLATP